MMLCYDDCYYCMCFRAGCEQDPDLLAYSGLESLLGGQQDFSSGDGLTTTHGTALSYDNVSNGSQHGVPVSLP
jgi:hypothetical protein